MSRAAAAATPKQNHPHAPYSRDRASAHLCRPLSAETCFTRTDATHSPARWRALRAETAHESVSDGVKAEARGARSWLPLLCRTGSVARTAASGARRPETGARAPTDLAGEIALGSWEQPPRRLGAAISGGAAALSTDRLCWPAATATDHGGGGHRSRSLWVSSRIGDRMLG